MAERPPRWSPELEHDAPPAASLGRKDRMDALTSLAVVATAPSPAQDRHDPSGGQSEKYQKAQIVAVRAESASVRGRRSSTR